MEARKTSLAGGAIVANGLGDHPAFEQTGTKELHICIGPWETGASLCSNTPARSGLIRFDREHPRGNAASEHHRDPDASKLSGAFFTEVFRFALFNQLTFFRLCQPTGVRTGVEASLALRRVFA